MNSDFIIAIHSLVYLKHKGKKVSSEELAGNVCTNSVRIRKVLSKLRERQLISTKEGMDGGYFYSAKERISLLDVYLALDMTLIHMNWHSGNLDAACLISSGMSGVVDEIRLQMEDLCKQQLATIYIDDMEHKLLSKGELHGI